MATIIKAGGPIRVSDGMSFNFDDMSTQANSYLATVQQQAAEIIAKAHKEAEAIRRKAEEEGKQAAIRAVEKVMEDKVGKQLATLIPALRQAVDGIAQAKQSWLLHWEKAAIRVSTQIAARIIRRELKTDPQITLGLIKETLELAAGSADLQIRMHPDDYATLGPHVETLVKAMSRDCKARVVADPEIEVGGCKIETQFGLIDQQIESQLKRIEEELT